MARDDQQFLESATATLKAVYDQRQLGANGDNAHCIFSCGDLYVQFLAPFDSDSILCEVASAFAVPWVAELITENKLSLLRDMGFAMPGQSRNYSKTVVVHEESEIRTLAQTLLRVLRSVYDIADLTSVFTTTYIPNPSNRMMGALNQGMDKIIAFLMFVLGIMALILFIAIQAKH